MMNRYTILCFLIGFLLLSSPLYAQNTTVIKGIFHIQVFGPNEQLLRTGAGYFVNKQGEGITHRDLFEGASTAKVVTADSSVHQIVRIVSEHPLTGAAKIATDDNLTTVFTVLPVSTTVLKRSEEHTSELQSRENLVCRLLLEKK